MRDSRTLSRFLMMLLMCVLGGRLPGKDVVSPTEDGATLVAQSLVGRIEVVLHRTGEAHVVRHVQTQRGRLDFGSQQTGLVPLEQAPGYHSTGIEVESLDAIVAFVEIRIAVSAEIGDPIDPSGVLQLERTGFTVPADCLIVEVRLDDGDVVEQGVIDDGLLLAGASRASED